MKRLVLGSDHAGFRLKEEIKKVLDRTGVAYEDLGTHAPDPCDYPEIAFRVACAISRGRHDRGILFCGAGVGQSVAANRVRGVRAALCLTPYMARMSREHNDANVLVLPGRILGLRRARAILNVWLRTPFSGEARHVRRIRMIDRLAKKGCERRG